MPIIIEDFNEFWNIYIFNLDFHKSQIISFLLHIVMSVCPFDRQNSNSCLNADRSTALLTYADIPHIIDCWGSAEWQIDKHLTSQGREISQQRNGKYLSLLMGGLQFWQIHKLHAVWLYCAWSVFSTFLTSSRQTQWPYLRERGGEPNPMGSLVGMGGASSSRGGWSVRAHWVLWTRLNRCSMKPGANSICKLGRSGHGHYRLVSALNF